MTGGARSLFICSHPRLHARRCTHAHPHTGTYRQVHTGVLTCTQAHTDMCTRAHVFHRAFLLRIRILSPFLLLPRLATCKALARPWHAPATLLRKRLVRALASPSLGRPRTPPSPPRGLWPAFLLTSGRDSASLLPEQRSGCGGVCDLLLCGVEYSWSC